MWRRKEVGTAAVRRALEGIDQPDIDEGIAMAEAAESAFMARLRPSRFAFGLISTVTGVSEDAELEPGFVMVLAACSMGYAVRADTHASCPRP